MVLKNVENKIKLVTIVCTVFLAGCIVISLGSVFTARQMVNDAHKQIYVLDSNVPILVKQTPQEVTLDIEAKADIDMFHHLFFTLAPDDKYIRYTIDKAMYLVDETGLAQYNALKEKGFYSHIMGTSMLFSIFCDSIKFNRDSLTFTYYGYRATLHHPVATADYCRTVEACPQDGEQPLRPADHQLENPSEQGS